MIIGIVSFFDKEKENYLNWDFKGFMDLWDYKMPRRFQKTFEVFVLHPLPLALTSSGIARAPDNIGTGVILRDL